MSFFPKHIKYILGMFLLKDNILAKNGYKEKLPFSNIIVLDDILKRVSVLTSVL
jgi:hypothetical protein